GTQVLLTHHCRPRTRSGTRRSLGGVRHHHTRPDRRRTHGREGIMNDKHAGTSTGRRMSRLDDPGRIAPHLGKSWRDDFIIELRLLDVPGNKIGDALVTADTHVQESRETAEEAFGDAKTYARETAAALGTIQSWRVTPADVV